jgi:diguanylate cyclase (GGDEF)-like protein/PAS domain S-box-containing protein
MSEPSIEQIIAENLTLKLQLTRQQWAETGSSPMEQGTPQEKELAANVLQSMGDAVIAADVTGAVQYLNPTAEQMTGWRLEQAKGLPLSEVFRVMKAPSPPQAIADVATAVTAAGKSVRLNHASTLIARDGVEYAIDGTAAPVRDRHSQTIGIVVVFRDVTQHHALVKKLSWQASHDFLTGLVNRREFEQRLAEAISSAQDTGQQHTLCYLDLDQFKIINDTCGHVAGDELLRQLSVLLRRRLRTTDTLARIGGDEFGIILHDCGPLNANSITDHLLTMIQGFRFVWQSNTFSIGASIGLVSINAQSHDLNSILGAADAACYAAKERGRNRIHVYQADDLDLVQQRGERRWIARITKALEEKRFCLYQQKIMPIDLKSGAKTHYELLLRMVSETGEVIAPMAFIPAAERYGLMISIDRWVVSHFFAAYKSLSQNILAESQDLDCVYAINLSGVSVSDDQFLAFLKEQFMVHEILPQTICFEITETAAIANLSKAAHLIEEIKEMGCSFALDDFGSGMSSFAYLKNLPVDYVKIDGSFIKNIMNDSVDSALVECMNRIGHEIGMQTIAEFVENDSILEKLRGFGVDYAQGYGIAKPSPLNFGLAA